MELSEEEKKLLLLTARKSIESRFNDNVNLPEIDYFTALAVSIWIMIIAIKIYFKSSTELMDGMKEPEFYCELFNAVKKVEGAYNPHRVRVRKIGSYHMISMDIEVDPQMKILEAHDIIIKVEESIRTNLPNVYDIVVHIEPLGNFEKGEKFGIKEEDVKHLGNGRK